MSLSKTKTVDLVIKGKAGAELSLVVEAGEWRLPEALQMLSDKLNGYAGFAVEGQLGELHPELRDRPVTIKVVSVDEIPPLAQGYIDRLRPVLEAEGLTLTSRRLYSGDEPLPPEEQPAAA